MAPRRSKNNDGKKKGDKKTAKKTASTTPADDGSNAFFDGNEACAFSLDDSNDSEEAKVEIEAEDQAQELDPNNNNNNNNNNLSSSNEDSFQLSFSVFKQTEDERLQKAGYKTETEVRQDLAQQPLARKDSIKRERMQQRRLTKQPSAKAQVEGNTEAKEQPSTYTSSSRIPGRANRINSTPPSRFNPFARSRRQPDEPSRPSHTDPFVYPPPLEEVVSNKKTNNGSNTTMDTNITEITMDDALRNNASSEVIDERHDEEVALAVDRERPRWPLLSWANPFPHRRAQRSTTRRVKQSKTERQSMRHGGTLGVLREGDSSLTDDETEETSRNNNAASRSTARRDNDDNDEAEATAAAAALPHGIFCTYWCWCWATRMCMISIILTVIITVTIALVMALVVNDGGDSEKGVSDSLTPPPTIRGSSTPTMSPVLSSPSSSSGGGGGSTGSSNNGPFSTTGSGGSPGRPTSSGLSSPVMDISSQLKPALPDFTIEAIQLGDPSSPQYKAYFWLLDHPQLDALPLWKQQQLLALVTFYYAFSGDDWPDEKKQDWLSYIVEECEWGDLMNANYWGNGCHNSTTAGAEGRFQHLNLDWFVGHTIGGFPSVIQGSHMPPEISLLTDLESLGIMSAGLQATLESLLPTELAALTSLQQLSFHYNEIIGTIPATITQLTGLQNVALGNNYLTGSIPSQMSSLTNLQELKMFNNRLEGSIPASLGSLTNMRGMNVIRNRLTGTIPTSLTQWTNLEYLFLDSNELTGSVPMNLCQLDNIEAIFVDCTMGCPVWGCNVCECY